MRNENELTRRRKAERVARCHEQQSRLVMYILQEMAGCAQLGIVKGLANGERWHRMYMPSASPISSNLDPDPMPRRAETQRVFSPRCNPSAGGQADGV